MCTSFVQTALCVFMCTKYKYYCILDYSALYQVDNYHQFRSTECLYFQGRFCRLRQQVLPADGKHCAQSLMYKCENLKSFITKM
jgi:hypothetical protein